MQDVHALYSTPTRRTEQTLAALARRLGLSINHYEVNAGAQLIRQLLQQPSPVKAVIVGHSNTLPDLLTSAGISSIRFIPETQFGDIFLVRNAGSSPELEMAYFGTP